MCTSVKNERDLSLWRTGRCDFITFCPLERQREKVKCSSCLLLLPLNDSGQWVNGRNWFQWKSKALRDHTRKKKRQEEKKKPAVTEAISWDTRDCGDFFLLLLSISQDTWKETPGKERNATVSVKEPATAERSEWFVVEKATHSWREKKKPMDNHVVHATCPRNQLPREERRL